MQVKANFIKTNFPCEKVSKSIDDTDKENIELFAWCVRNGITIS